MHTPSVFAQTFQYYLTNYLQATAAFLGVLIGVVCGDFAGHDHAHGASHGLARTGRQEDGAVQGGKIYICT